MNKALGPAVAGTVLAAAMLAVTTQAGTDARPVRYVVVYADPASPTTARDAIASAGGQIVRENARVGVATVVSSNPGFRSDVARAHGIEGVARNVPIGRARPLLRPKLAPEQLRALRNAARSGAIGRSSSATTAPGDAEPLAPNQWDMRMINATPDGSYGRERGDKKVLVGVLDTGIDASHPDIAPNFDRTLSRNFTVDVPLVDGPCAEDPDGSCNDPADVDENSHGTHVASTIASPINKLGVAGVAPDVTLVNLRAGQDSGYFFLQATVDALTYAGDNGVDVVNMSYFIDPWLFNCLDNPADSPEARVEQRTIRVATQRALDYAHERNVTLVAAGGNDHIDLGHPTSDDTSPDFPPGADYHRTVDNTCLVLPTEGPNVMSVSSIGPTERKSDFSNYGLEQTTVAAPGGFFRDDPWSLSMTPAERNAAGIPNQILAAYPESVARAFGDLEPDGTPNTPFVVRDCAKGTCGYYQWIQGTSMASPHAVGVAALIVSKYGDKRGGGITMAPADVERILTDTARDHACPEPRLHSYADKGRPASFDALCEGDAELNGFYGHGIIDAAAAVSAPRGTGR